MLQLLAAVCLVSGGHGIILIAFDNFKDVSVSYYVLFHFIHVFLNTCVQTIFANLLSAYKLLALLSIYLREKQGNKEVTNMGILCCLIIFPHLAQVHASYASMNKLSEVISKTCRVDR